MKKLLLGALLTVSLFSCNTVKEYELVKFQGLAQGTYYSISYFDAEGRNFQTAIDSLLDAFNHSLSLWEPSSIISRINRNEPGVEVDDLFRTVYLKAREVAKHTNGAFDYSVGPLVNAWGFGFTDRMKLSPHKIDSLMQYVGFETIKLEGNTIVKINPGSAIDFNAIAKGYAVDVIGKFIEKKGITRYIVDIGGEVYARNRKPDGELWKVGVEKPATHAFDERNLKIVLTLENEAIATSGNYRKYYEENGVRYAHTIDPKTGYPVNHSLLSASVLAKDCMTADAYATAFMVMGIEKAREFVRSNPGMEAFFIFSDAQGGIQTWASPGFEKKIVDQFD